MLDLIQAQVTRMYAGKINVYGNEDVRHLLALTTSVI